MISVPHCMILNFFFLLNFKNEFGTVQHDMIKHTYQSEGFPQEFINIIDDLYSGSITQIVTNKFSSDDIDIKIGAKKGSIASPLLFILYLGLLLEAITRINRHNSYFFKVCDRVQKFHPLILLSMAHRKMVDYPFAHSKYIEFIIYSVHS